ncbi:hypothetical protein [Actinoplanes sp. NPDC023714]|uniref:hypothetical protein n=1 Tax=Actinoplanes sp. NPDC023714 TaxID=3154322 RepID=UPI0033CC55F2
MSVLTRPAVLLATASAAAGLLATPGAAHAAAPAQLTAAGTRAQLTAAGAPAQLTAAGTRAQLTAAGAPAQLTAAQMAAELDTIAAASTAAGSQGWKTVSDYTFTFPGSATVIRGSGATQADLVRGRYADRFTTIGFGSADYFAVDRTGRWEPVQEQDEQRALAMMGRASVKYAYTADAAFDLGEYLTENAPSPVAMTAGIDGGGTKVTHDDGSADLTATDEQGAGVVLHVGASGLLTGAHLAVGGGEDGTAAEVEMAFAYGPQTVTMPTGAETIPVAALAKGVAYLTMADDVKALAGAAATATRTKAKGGTVKVATLRKVARNDVTSWNRTSIVKFTVKDVTGGVKVSATNPWTKKTVAYTVKASGKKVVVKKA